MATFLTMTDSSAAIERVIREAEGKLTLISAFVFPRIVHLQRLRDAGEGGVEITILFGKKPMDQGVFRDLRELPNMKLYFLKELHAKCYFNEREGVVTSLNLLGGSEHNNREMGVLLSATSDADAYAAMCKEAKSIIRASDLIHSTVPEPLLKREIPEWGARVASIAPNEELPSEPISTIEKVRKQHPRAYLRWTPEEDALFLEMLDKGMARLAICGVLQRQPSAIASRILKLRGDGGAPAPAPASP
jgi:phosphatidylserine/phosphatidylglycerophosphate/cardiolipin synthase-like enzyme